MKIFLGSGWYAQTLPRSYKTYGDEIIRSPKIRKVWWDGIDRFIRPEFVCIVDSNSPIPPPEKNKQRKKTEIIKLCTNPGHPQTTSLTMSGWTASVILSLEFAYLNGADLFLYLEQDAFVFGNGILLSLRDLIKKSKFIFGNRGKTPQLLQQSFFAIHREGMPQFISRMHMLKESDNKCSPETKFFISTLPSVYFIYVLACLSLGISQGNTYVGINKILSVIWKKQKTFATWPFGFGRDRPINFKSECFYFQHGTSLEIECYRHLLKA